MAAARLGATAARGLYHDLSSKEILEKLFLLRLCGSSKFIKNAHKLHGASATVLGERLTDWVMKNVLVKHFVTADNYRDFAAEAQRLLHHNVRVMMVPSMEDISDDYTSETEGWCRSNMQKFLREEEVVVGLNEEYGTKNIMQFKLSAVVPTFAMNAYSAACHKKQVPLADAGHLIGQYFNQGDTKVVELLDNDKEKAALRLGLDLSKEIFEV